MKKVLFTSCLTIAVSVLYAQNTSTYMNNYVQPAPNAAALGKYVDFPVSYYTGVPEISIPVYNLKDGGVSVPVSLSYHSSGIRVSEVASWVGLGWSLNAGGMIIRTVRGVPDEGTSKGSIGQGSRGYYLDSGLRKMPLLNHPNGGQLMNDAANLQMQLYTIPNLNSGFMEGEPDLFTFNFNGYSGKFVFDENRIPRLLTDEDLKISVNYTPGQFISWVITTPDGIRYCFGENNTYEVTLPHSTLSGDDQDSQRPSSWLLTRIINPNTKDTVTFSYTSESYTYFDLGPENKTYNFLNGATSDNPAQICSNSGIQKNTMRTTVNGQRLTEIKSRNYDIVFVASTQRQDISNYTTRPNALDSIRVLTTGGQYIARYGFQYTYFQSSLATQALLTNPSMPVDSSDAKRLKLLSFSELSADGSIPKPPYIFLYQDTFALPRRLSYDQDHWGYSNTTTGNANPFFSTSIDMGSICSGGGGASRTPNWPQMESYTLLGIQDPLGVRTKYEFEPDSADNYYPDKIVGGLRVKKITVTDSLTGSQVVRKFKYLGGVLFKTPTYIFPLKNEFYIRKLYGYLGYGNQMVIGYVRQSQSIVPLQDIQGTQVGYNRVKEVFGNNGEGGSKDYVFYLNTGPQTMNSRLDLNNYASLQSVQTVFNGVVTCMMGNGHFNDLTPETLQYYTGYDVNSYYPFAPEQVDLRRGKLIREYTYDSSGQTIRQVSNTYNETYHENYQIRGIKVLQTVYSDPSLVNNTVTQYNSAITFYKLHTGISHLTKATTIDYKDGKAFTTVTNYGYESAYHTLKTSDTTVNSQGDSIISKTYYTFDYTDNATGDNTLGKMKGRNILLPVASRTWKNNQLINGTITLYKDFAASGSDTFLNPSKIYAIETSTPLTTVQASEGIALTGQFSTLIPNSYFKEKASFTVNGTTGRISEQRLVNDKNQALIWDNTYVLPLAQVDNAFIADVGYSGFETAETGNLTYSSGSVVTDATAPTGAKAYSLSGGLSKSGLTTGKKYILSYWQKSGASVSVSGGTQSNGITGRLLNGYTYHQVTITGTTTITLSGSGNIDEVRVHPADAQMTTYTYDALLRLIALCGPNNTINYYEYDSMNRLTDIKDQYGNVVKAYEYNYGRLSRP